MANPGVDVQFMPGEGPARSISVSFTIGTYEAVRQRVGKRGVSKFIEEATVRALNRALLSELVDSIEEATGPFDAEEVAKKTAILRGEAAREAGAA
ncbi:hypothetical protein [Nocardia sp. NPDC051832]|uniref:hypothetical protein n=1 Tax=Nocardia sp. NPDC051832 TaxID=3155673 RepID=UPI00343ACB79